MEMNGDIERIRAALQFVDSNDRETWLKMTFAIKDELGDAGRDLWEAWSQQAETYQPASARDVWKSTKATGPVKIGTLFRAAKMNGWSDDGTYQYPTPAALDERRRIAVERTAIEEVEVARKRANTAKKAAEIYQVSAAVVDNPYLLRKGVSPTAALREIETSAAVAILGYAPKSGDVLLVGRLLLVPVQQGEKLSTLELIDGEGRKAALVGRGSKAGGYWTTEGLPDGDGTALALLIGEGVATVLSAKQASGYLAIAALSAGNLAAVAKAMRKRYPAAQIIVLADLNKKTGAPDRLAAAAALAVGGLLAVPDFGPGPLDGMKDFNDLAVMCGPDAVRRCIDAAMDSQAAAPAPEKSEVSAPWEQGEVAADMQAATVASMAKTAKRTKETKQAAQLADGVPHGFTIERHGVFFTPEGTDGKPGTPMRVCSPLRVTALIRDRSSENWGRVIEFNDADGIEHKWAIPAEMLAGDGLDVRRELSRLGLAIGSGIAAKNRLSQYLIESAPKVRARCVQQTGWFGNVFVMPDRAIGDSSEVVLYQSESKTVCQYIQSGTLDQWRNNVANLCIGNSRLIFAVSASFAGMILHHAGQESGGVHFVGSSSTGKSTAQLVAASVYGSPSFKQTWRATGNALEGTCALHNDAALILDEMAEVDPKDVGSIVYMIGNGTGKGRAGRTGEVKARKTWRLMIISSGEIGLAQHMRDGGKIAKAGQEVRMIDIAADAGAGHGLFEELHGHDSGAKLADAIKEATQAHYGMPAIAFLERLTSELKIFPGSLKQAMSSFVLNNLPADAGGQAERVCGKFALIAVAGEYATSAGITGWRQGDALAAASACFKSWLDSRGGGGNQERSAILSSVKAFFESHGASRFEDMAATNEQRIINRVGFYRAGTNGEREFLVMAEAFKRELCQGFSEKTVKAVLVESGMLIPGKDGRPTQMARLPGIGPTKAYVIQYCGSDE